MARLKENLLYMMIHDFLADYLTKKRNSSSHTVKAYRTALNQLLDFTKEQKQIRLVDITFDILNDGMAEKYLDFLEETKKCSIKTRNYRLNCLRAFYSYAAMRDASLVVYQSTLFQIPFKKTEKVETVDYLSKGAIQALLAQPDAGSKKGTRDLFLMSLMYDTAARVQEIIDLKICDIRLGDTPQVKLHGKGNKSRSIPLMKVLPSRLLVSLALQETHSSTTLRCVTLILKPQAVRASRLVLFAPEPLTAISTATKCTLFTTKSL